MIVLFAYGCAAINAAFLLILMSNTMNGDRPLEGLNDIRSLGVFALLAAIYAAPVALPVMLAAELRKTGKWKTFVGAGALLGVLLTFLFTETPFEWSNLLFSGIFFPIAVIAAYIYWLVAWKWMSPTNRESIELGRANL